MIVIFQVKHCGWPTLNKTIVAINFDCSNLNLLFLLVSYIEHCIN